jgi:hypothetical protein
MTQLARVKVVWDGWSGGPGVNVLHFSQGAPATMWSSAVIGTLLSELVTAYSGAKGSYPTGVGVTVPSHADIIDVASGQIQDVVSVTDNFPRLVSSAPGASLPPATMALIRLRTNHYANGKLLQGRIFNGPFDMGSITPDGDPTSTLRTQLLSGWTNLIQGADSRLCVYHRPPTVPNGGDFPPSTPTGGFYGDVTSMNVWDKFSTLRSRRD